MATWQALGTTAVLVVTGAERLGAARAAVERELALIDCTCSRFREDSDLSRVNAHAGSPVRVDRVLIEALEVALRAARLTGGDVDPTVGMALELAGYDRDWRLLDPAPASAPDQAPAPSRARPRVRARLRPGWRAIEIDRGRSTVRVPAGVKLDLGATAKAWAADRASKAAHEASGAGVLVSLGGDISTGGEAPAGGWRVHVTDDHRSGPDAPGQRIAICGGGLATSSTVARRWRHGGATRHHLIDPASGQPAEGPWRTVSVAAADCTDANIASTAALVRGGEAPEWLAGLGMPARLVRHDGRVVTTGAWPEAGAGAGPGSRRGARPEAQARELAA